MLGTKRIQVSGTYVRTRRGYALVAGIQVTYRAFMLEIFGNNLSVPELFEHERQTCVACSAQSGGQDAFLKSAIQPDQKLRGRAR